MALPDCASLARSSLIEASFCTLRPVDPAPYGLCRFKYRQVVCHIKNATQGDVLYMAGPTGFEPAISSVTGRRDRPLHYEPSPSIYTKDRGNHSNYECKKQTFYPCDAQVLDRNEGFWRRLFTLRLSEVSDWLEVELDVRCLHTGLCRI